MGDGSSTCFIFHPRPCFDHNSGDTCQKRKEFTENIPQMPSFSKVGIVGMMKIVLTLAWFSLGSNTRKLTLLVTLNILINKLLLLFAIGFEVLLGVVSNGVYDRFCCLVLPVEIAHRFEL